MDLKSNQIVLLVMRRTALEKMHLSTINKLLTNNMALPNKSHQQAQCVYDPSILACWKIIKAIKMKDSRTVRDLNQGSCQKSKEFYNAFNKPYFMHSSFKSVLRLREPKSRSANNASFLAYNTYESTNKLWPRNNAPWGQANFVHPPSDWQDDLIKFSSKIHLFYSEFANSISN